MGDDVGRAAPRILAHRTLHAPGVRVCVQLLLAEDVALPIKQRIVGAAAAAEAAAAVGARAA